MRTGIFGGTFDPPHEGHRKFAEEFIGRLSLDRLIVIPTFIPPHKTHGDTADSADRMKMTELLFEDNPDVQVSDMEIERKGKSYTCDTVKLLHEKYPDDELIFLMGSDMLFSFHRWKNPDTILRYVRICAVTRTTKTDTQALTEYVKEHFPQDVDKFIIRSFSPCEVSSTCVRAAIRSGKPTDGMINRRIEEYIKVKELYL